MGKYLNPGNAGFQAIRKGLYVDKSMLIEEINKTLGSKNKLTCFTRPRRFGKSFAAQMLCAYYDCSCDSSALFKDLKIAGQDDYMTHLNKYQVIYIDLLWFLSNWNKASSANPIRQMQEAIIDELTQAYPLAEAAETLPLMICNISEQYGLHIPRNLRIRSVGTERHSA